MDDRLPNLGSPSQQLVLTEELSPPVPEKATSKTVSTDVISGKSEVMENPGKTEESRKSERIKRQKTRKSTTILNNKEYEKITAYLQMKRLKQINLVLSLIKDKGIQLFKYEMWDQMANAWLQEHEKDLDKAIDDTQKLRLRQR